jgi:hypothetical protein
MISTWPQSLVLMTILCWGGASNPVWGDNPPKVLPRGHVYFQSDFEGPNPLAGWSAGGNTAEGYQSARALHLVRNTDDNYSKAMVSMELPAKEMRGYMLNCSAMVKANGVSDKPHPWNGIKYMLVFETASGKQWPQAPLGTGSFDWQRIFFAVRVPDEATRVTLYLGLEAVTGEAWFDNVQISVRKPPLPAPPPAPTEPAFKGHSFSRLRGAMISPGIDEAGLQTLGGKWNANLIRWQLIHLAPAGKTFALPEYDAWLAGELKKLDAALPLCEKYGLQVVIDLHSPPGGKGAGSYTAANDRLFTDKACQDKLVQVWQLIAKRYRNARAVWGYDLANEPDDVGVNEECDDWQDLAERTAKAVRAVDPDRAIIVEPANWGNPDGLAGFRPVNVPKVVYSVHMYTPHAFTHQGVFGASKPNAYPGQVDGEMWDKARLEKALKPVVEFQEGYGVHIFIGEFSAIRWAPGDSACNYLRDLIDIFESHGWDWTYHAFREWQGWSVEHTGDRDNTKPASEPTDREKLLRQWFAKNQKPPTAKL